MKMLLSFQYLLDEVGHFHLRPVLGHVRLHLRVRIINDGQEHVLHKQRDKVSVSDTCPSCSFSTTHKCLSHHENKENEEDEGYKVNWSENWVRFFDLEKVKVSQNDTKLGKPENTTTANMTKTDGHTKI